MKNKAKTKKLSPADCHAHTRQSHNLELAEDYVEAIAELIEISGEARVLDIAKHLGVTHVSVTRAISRLKTQGLVLSEPYRAVYLTPKGARLAKACKKRHELVYNFLLALGIPKTAAQRDAEGIEHHVGKETLNAFGRFLSSVEKGK